MRKLLVAAALLLASPAVAQQGVPYFPQTLQSGTIVGRLSSGPGPVESITFQQLLNQIFPVGSSAYNFNAASVLYQGSVSGAVTTKAQAATANYTLFWPSTVGTNGYCFMETVSGAVATGGWTDCAKLSANNTFTGNNTFSGTTTHSGLFNATGTFQWHSTTQTFPGSGVIVGTTDSQTLTNKSIDASQLTGTIATARLPAGIDANVLLTKTANYTVATSDCGKTIGGSGGPWTLTLPAVAGFASTCVVQACNLDANDNTHHAIRLSGWPAPSFVRLWMQQCQEVSIVNGAWIVTKWPGKFRPAVVPTLFVDTGGSDANDGLVSNAAANALLTVQTCWTIFQREMDLGTAQPTCSPTAGQTFNGGLTCSAGMVPTVYNLYGNGGSFNLRNTGGNVVVQLNDFCGYIIFDAVNIDCTSAASHPCTGLFIHQQNGADLSTAGHTTGVTFTGANTSDNAVVCDSMCKINSGAVVTLAGGGGMANGFQMNLGSMLYVPLGVTVANGTTISNNIFQILSGSQLVYSGPMTAGTPVSIGQIFGVQGNGSSVCIGSLTVSGTFTGARQWAVLNQATLINQSATAVPGSAGINTSAGWLNGAVTATSAAGC